MRIVQLSVGSVRMPPREASAPLQVVFKTSEHLARMGHEVVILDRRYSAGDPAVERIEGVEIARLKALQLPSIGMNRFLHRIVAELNATLFALAASRYLRRNRANIDVVHLHLTSIGLILSLLNGGLRSRMVYTCHLGQWALAGTRISLSEKLHLLLDSVLMKRMKAVIALSDAARERFVLFGGIGADKVIVIPNGVDTGFFNPHIQMEESTRTMYRLDSRIVVLFVGRLAKTKGLECLLSAADAIVNRLERRDVLFLLVGPSEYGGVEKRLDTGEILEFVRRHSLENNVTLTGSLPLEEVRAFYPACDVFVLPSIIEGDPLVVLEALASGKPIVGTRVGGIPGKVRDGWNGFLVVPGDGEALAEKIAYLIDRPEERARMGRNSRTLAEEEFDWGKIARRLSDIYMTMQERRTGH